LDADEDQHYNTSSPDALGNADDNEVDEPAEPELGSQAQPLEISSSDSDNEPRRSGRAKRSTRASEILFLQKVYGRRLGFTAFYRLLYGHGIQSFLFCVPIASYSVASSSCVVLLVTLTIVHFDGASIHSIHNIAAS